MIPAFRRRPRLFHPLAACLVFALKAAGQAPDSAWVYPSAAGDLLYQLDERGQRIADFSNCGYRGGTGPLPNVSIQIPQSRWVKVSPGAGDDTALIQNAINSVAAMTPDSNGWRGVVYLNAGEYEVDGSVSITSGGIVLKGAGDDATTGTRLRATGLTQDTLIKVTGSGSRSTVSGTTHNLTQTLVPAGTRTFQVDSTSGLAAGNTLIVKRPSTANWIADMDMDLLGPGSGGEIDDVPWTAGSKDLLFDRVITRIDGNWITVDAPLPQTFESKYGGGQVWKYTWSGRIGQVGIEDIYGFSDYANSTDEAHAWSFIQMANIQNGWVRNITARYFGYSAVRVSDGAKWITVTDSQCLDAISIITGSRRYSFNNEGAELTLFQNNYAREGRHDFVFGSSVPGPNAFVQGKGDTVHSDTGPHHRWSVGGLFDNITVNGNELNAQNRGNMGTGHGWAGGYMAVWNSVATGFRVRNPPTARNWLVGSIGNLLASSAPVGADPAGTYDRSGTAGKAVYPQSLYYAQLQQVLKWPDSQFRESWLGDIDQFASTGGTGNSVNCNAAWLAEVQALGSADSTFDFLTGNRSTAFTFDFALDPGDTIVSASLTVSLRDVGAASADDSIRLDSTANDRTYASLGWTPVSSTTPAVRTMAVDPALLADGRLNVALGADSAVDFATLHYQVRKAQPSTHTVTLDPVADTYVQGGTNATTSFGTATTLQTKDITASTVNRESFIRWDLTGLAGRLVQAKVRLAGTSASQEGNQSCATLVRDDTWDEATLTFNNKPAAGTLFAQWLPVTGQPVEFSVTPQAAATLTDDGKLSLRIVSTGNYGASGNVTYASRENPVVANRPQLVLTFENKAPSISDVEDLSIPEDTVTAPLRFMVGDDFTPGESLAVSTTSSDLSLVPNDHIVVSGIGTNRSVTVTPLPGRSGTATITLTVSDGPLTASDTFVLTVMAVADPPAAGSGTAATPANQAVEVDLRTLVSDSETPVDGLRFSVTGAAGGAVVLLADGHTARFTPTLGFSGAASFGYTVTDATVDPRILLNYSFQPPDITADGSSSDVSGNSRDGTITDRGTSIAAYTAGAPTALFPQQTQSLLLTGNGTAGASRLQRAISPTTELNFQTADWTFAGWVKRANSADQDIIFHLGAANGRGGTDDFVLCFGNGTTNTPLYLKNWSSTLDVDISTPVSAGVWHHLAVVRGGSTLSLYVDGAVIASDNSFSITASNASPAIFGGGASTTTSVYDRWFNGSMADLAIFDTALTPSDIAKLFAAPASHLGGQTTGNTVNVSVIQQIEPIAYWRQHYFQTPENSGIAADTEDPDHDGLANSREYILGTIPNVADLAPFLTPASSGSQITLVFTARQADGPGYTGLTRHYAVESAGEPGNAAGWAPVAGYANLTGQNQSVELTLPATETRGFFRLRVWLD